MKVEIINKPMLCWDRNESEAREYHVLAKITECSSDYSYKVVSNENTYLHQEEGYTSCLKNAKPLPEVTELIELKVTKISVADLSKLLGKTIKIVE